MFFLPAIVWGILIEFLTQEIYLHYHYGLGFLLNILNVPLNISLAWATLLYWGYGFAKARYGN